MNMQSMLKQAQSMQKKMMQTQEEINSKTFYGESSYVKVEIMGGNVKSIKIDTDSIEKDDIELLEDMLIVAINNAKEKYDKEMEEKMGAYTKGIPGLF